MRFRQENSVVEYWNVFEGLRVKMPNLTEAYFLSAFMG